jgi:hypothetical protein
MKKIIINYLIYFYITYIVEDFSVLKPFGKILIYPFWFIRTLILFTLSPLFIFEYLILESNFYKNLKSDIDQIIG